MLPNSNRTKAQIKTPIDWYSLGYSQSSASQAVSGNGSFLYAMVGNNLMQSQTSASGLAFGVEQGTWDYNNQTDVTKKGLSVGTYGSHQLQNGLSISGSAMATLFQNTYTQTGGATATAGSNRLLLSGKISRPVSGSNWTPYAEMNYATESLQAYSYNGGTTTYAANQATVGEISLGAQYHRSLGSNGQLVVQGAVSSGFGTTEIELPNGQTYKATEEPTGSLSVGWQASDEQTGASRSVSLTMGGIGNSGQTETSLKGDWTRPF